MTATNELTIRLPRPHPKQREFIASPAKRKVIVAGRRVGKTTGTAILACQAVGQGRRVLQAAPTMDQTEAFWHWCTRAFAEPIAAGYVYKNETRRVLEFPNGGRIRTKTAHDADTLRGDSADLLILEEYSLMDPTAWTEVGAPMLLDNDGDAVFIFTPKRKNHAYHTYLRAMSDTSGRWQGWQFTSHDNPHLSAEALAEITEDMTEDGYRQEILAEFLDSAGAVFRNIRDCLHAPTDTTPDAHAGHTLVMGADWGKQNDHTALSIVCRDCASEVALDYFNQIDYHLQRARLIALYRAWDVRQVVAESNAMGEPNIEELQRAGLDVTPFVTTATSKPPLIESLVLAFERRECQWRDDAIATTELEAYERKVNPVTNRATYSAPDGVHDDTVMARALAWHGVTNYRPTGGIFL